MMIFLAWLLVMDFALTGNASAWIVLGIGFAIGLRHAVEPDHIAAVSTIACAHRRSLWRSALIGGWWGLGHTLALLGAGVLVILLQVRISQSLGDALELGVGVMLVLLGLNLLLQLALGKPGADSYSHSHPHVQGLKMGWRPLLIGLVHGMAGSAALLLVAVAQIQTTTQKFLFLLVFGLGSIGGMMLMSVLLSLPAYWTAERFVPLHKAVSVLAGVFSFCLGLWMIYEIGFVHNPLIRAN